jgi:cytoskeletal protein CcmA (bactofilin family)
MDMALAEQPLRKDDGSPRPESRVEPPQPTPAGSARPSESVLAAGLTIEGKISGNGHLRLAGRFTGNIDVKGELTIEPGAGIQGEVKADTVLVGGEIRGNVISKSRVDLRESGVLIGDLKAESLTVAAGSKMRGQAEFGWKDGEARGLDPVRGKPGR